MKLAPLVLVCATCVLTASEARAQGASSAGTTSPSTSSAPWINADYVYWRIDGDSLPALVSTGSTLLTANTQVLFGGGTENQGWSSGVRVRAGSPFGAKPRLGVAGGFFTLGEVKTTFTDSSTGTPIIARPFVNTSTGQQDAEVVAFGTSPGNVAVNLTSAVFGGDVGVTQALCTSCSHRLQLRLGYRLLHLADHFDVTSHSQTSLGGQSLTIDIGDHFATTTTFHGVNAGISGTEDHGAWSTDWHAALAAGVNRSAISIAGSTTAAIGTSAPSTLAGGGLLALSSNIGSSNDSRGAVVVDLGADFGIRLSKQCRLVGGYTFMDWRAVMRPGGVIDTTVNPNLVPPATSGGPSRPTLQKNPASVAIQGVNVGVVFRF